MKIGRALKRLFKIYLYVAGVFLLIFILWGIVGAPIYIDRICILSQSPVDADYVVCISGGLTTGNLPTDDGWGRIYTAVQLYLDGFGRKIVFTGGGSEKVSEAEVYAEAAGWLGLAEADALIDPGPNQTSEHPKNIMKIAGAGITRETPLDIVTSPLHSKRTALCFKKAGFINFRMVTGYEATGLRMVSRPDAAAYLRAEKESNLPAFKQSDKVYDDILLRLKWRSKYFFNTLRELAALAVYKLKGYI